MRVGGGSVCVGRGGWVWVGVWGVGVGWGVAVDAAVGGANYRVVRSRDCAAR